MSSNFFDGRAVSNRCCDFIYLAPRQHIHSRTKRGRKLELPPSLYEGLDTKSWNLVRTNLLYTTRYTLSIISAVGDHAMICIPIYPTHTARHAFFREILEVWTSLLSLLLGCCSINSSLSSISNVPLAIWNERSSYNGEQVAALLYISHW